MTQIDRPRGPGDPPGIDPRWAAYVVLAAMAIGMALFSATAILSTQARFSKIFNDFGVELLPVTQMCLGLTVPALLLALAGVTLAKEFFPTMRRFGVIWNAAVLLLGFGVLGLYVSGVFAPLMQLLRGLQ